MHAMHKCKHVSVYYCIYIQCLYACSIYFRVVVCYVCIYVSVCLYVYVHICMLKYCIACSSSSRFAASASRLNWYSSSWAIRKSFPSSKGMIGEDADYIEIKFSLVN